MTKEEILKDKFQKPPDGVYNPVHEAMDEYAKQDACDFAEFIKKNYYAKSDEGWFKYFTQVKTFPSGISMHKEVINFLTIDQVYEIYQQSKINQP